MSRSDFALFYESSFHQVLAAAQAFTSDRDVAYESTQEAFARAFARWRRVSAASSPEAWVVTTALNLCRRHFRRRGSLPRGDLTAPEASADRLDMLSALRSLPERQRQAAVLHYIADYPVAAVADAMGISDGAVKAHLSKARDALRRSLEVRHA
ncbi:MAG: sigma-70 family RNA polymerase sigma factor [Actinomycetota bacterium]